MPIVEIASLESEDLSIVVVHWHDDRAPSVFSPFSGRRVKAAYFLSEQSVFCFSEKGEAGLFHPGDGREIRCVSTGFRPVFSDSIALRYSPYVIVHDSLHLLLVHKSTLEFLLFDAMSLVYGIEPNGKRPNVSSFGTDLSSLKLRWMVERDDGILIGSFVCHKEFGVYRLDPSDWSVQSEHADSAAFCPVHNPLRWFSPSGRKALRFGFGLLPADSGGQPVLADAEPLHFPHPDCRQDGLLRFGAILQLWQTWPVRFESQIVVLMEPHSGKPEHRDLLVRRAMNGDWDGSPASVSSANPGWAPVGDIEADRELDWLFMSRSHRIGSAGWQPDEEAFWVSFNHSVFRRVSVDGELSPLVLVDRWRTPGQPLMNINSLNMAFEFTEDGSATAGNERIGYVRLPKVEFASPTELVRISESQDGFRPGVKQRDPLLSAHILSRARWVSSHRLYIDDVDCKSVAHTLSKLAEDIEIDFGGMLRNDRLLFQFICGE